MSRIAVLALLVAIPLALADEPEPRPSKLSKEQLEIQASGTRILLAVEPIDVLSRLLPDRQLRERVEFAGDLLAAAKSLRIEHENGTNLVYRLGKYPTITEYGFA